MEAQRFSKRTPYQCDLVNAVSGAVYNNDPVPPLNRDAKGLYAFTADADNGNNGNEGNVEIVRGTEIYRYDFAANNFNLIRSLPAPYNTKEWTEDANVAIADMDKDGDVDAVITKFENDGSISDTVTEILIWDMQTNQIVAGPWRGTKAGGSRAFIGNFDTDPEPEFAFTCSSLVVAFDDVVNSNGGAGGFEELWDLVTLDGSGHTQMTGFDFDGDGTLELCYRDSQQFRIFSGLGDGAVMLGSCWRPVWDLS